MNYKKINNKIIIEDTSNFNIAHILDCGQVFRYLNCGDCYTLYAKNHKCLLQNENDCVIINSKDIDFFIEYFDLDRDYTKIKANLEKYEYLDDALKYGSGIRILNQDPIEMIISFIISANNNIPRIKLIIEKLCKELGEYIDGYYAFPKLEALAKAEVSLYKEIGAGYRAEYISTTSKMLFDSFDIDSIKLMDTKLARAELMKLKGVGSKVADCILLFGYHKTDLFPMDTWSIKLYNQLGMPKNNDIKVMSNNLVAHYGTLSGYAQQYLYYYIRKIKNITKTGGSSE